MTIRHIQIINVPSAVYTMFHICKASRDGSFFFLLKLILISYHHQSDSDTGQG